MRNREKTITYALLACAVLARAVPGGQGLSSAEEFTATATVKTEGGASATAPVTIAVERKMSHAEAEQLVAAFKSGGTAGLRAALQDVPPTGSVRLGGRTTPSRLTIERPTDKGRLLTIVTVEPVLFLGAGLVAPRPREGYDFGVIDIEVDSNGAGSGSLAGAAKVTVSHDAFVVEDYSGEIIRLSAVRKTR
jgi:hypothetical protein